MSEAEPTKVLFNKLIIHPSIERIKGMSYQPIIMKLLEDISRIPQTSDELGRAVTSREILCEARPNELHYSQLKLFQVKMKFKCYHYTPLN